MRIKVEGRVDRERLHEIVEKIANKLEEYDIREMRGLNLYFVPLHPETGEEAVIMMQNTIDDLRRRLDESTSDLRQAQSKLTALLTDDRPAPPSAWSRWLPRR